MAGRLLSDQYFRLLAYKVSMGPKSPVSLQRQLYRQHRRGSSMDRHRRRYLDSSTTDGLEATDASPPKACSCGSFPYRLVVYHFRNSFPVQVLILE